MNRKQIFVCVVVTLLASVRAPGADKEDVDSALQRLSEMSAAEKQELEDKRERFYRLSEAEQERLRQVHRDLCRADDGDELKQVMARYSRWLRSLPSGQRAELLSMPPESRLEQIKLLLQQQEQWRMRNYVMRELTEEDLSVIVKWMEDFVSAHEAEILQRVPHLRERWGSIDPSRRKQSLVFAATMGARDLLRPTDEDIQQLKDRLSDSAKEELAKAEREKRLSELAERWMRAAMFSRRSAPAVPREELQRFYTELDARQREYLENLPAERMEQELTRLYHYSQFRKFFDSDRPPFSGPGFGFRGRGRSGWPNGGGPPQSPMGSRPKGPSFRPPSKDHRKPDSSSTEHEDLRQ